MMVERVATVALKRNSNVMKLYYTEGIKHGGNGFSFQRKHLLNNYVY